MSKILEDIQKKNQIAIFLFVFKINCPCQNRRKRHFACGGFYVLFQLQPSCGRGSVHRFTGFYSAVHGGFAASEHPCDARNGALYEENLPVTEYAQYVRALVHGKAPDDICCVKNLPRAERSWQQKSYFISLSS